MYLTKEEVEHLVQIMKHRENVQCQFCQDLLEKLESEITT